MPKPRKPIEKRHSSRFILIRQHRRLLADKRANVAQARDSANVMNNSKENALASTNRKIANIEKELGYTKS